MNGRIRVNHGGNGANKSFFKPKQDVMARGVEDEETRSARFFVEKGELERLTREAQARARGGC